MKTKHVNPQRLEVLIPLLIGLLLLIVRSPIQFDNERGGMTIEIRNQTMDDLLSPKVEPVYLISPNRIP
jgi:hypothetical protein